MFALRMVVGGGGGLVLGFVVTMAFSGQWLDYLTGEPVEWNGMSPLFLVLLCVMIPLYGYQVAGLHYPISPRLRLHRSILAVYGLMLLLLAGALLIGRLLYGMLVEPGQLGRSIGRDPATPWTTAHWVVYNLPLVVAVVAVVAGVVMLVVGLRSVPEVTAFNREVARRRQMGQRFLGRIATAQAVPDRPDLTHVVAEFAAPDGTRQVVATVEGDQRRWLQSAKAEIHIDVRRPYDPAGILLTGRSFWRAQMFLVDQALPPVVAPPGAAPPGLLR